MYLLLTSAWVWGKDDYVSIQPSYLNTINLLKMFIARAHQSSYSDKSGKFFQGNQSWLYGLIEPST
jgi:hypothetical protein